MENNYVNPYPYSIEETKQILYCLSLPDNQVRAEAEKKLLAAKNNVVLYEQLFGLINTADKALTSQIFIVMRSLLSKITSIALVRSYLKSTKEIPERIKGEFEVINYVRSTIIQTFADSPTFQSINSRHYREVVVLMTDTTIFPSKWDQLVEVIISILSTADESSIGANLDLYTDILTIVLKIFKKFAAKKMKSTKLLFEPLKEPLMEAIIAFFSKTQVMFTQLAENTLKKTLTLFSFTDRLFLILIECAFSCKEINEHSDLKQSLGQILERTAMFIELLGKAPAFSSNIQHAIYKNIKYISRVQHLNPLLISNSMHLYIKILIYPLENYQSTEENLIKVVYYALFKVISCVMYTFTPPIETKEFPETPKKQRETSSLVSPIKFRNFEAEIKASSANFHDVFNKSTVEALFSLIVFKINPYKLDEKDSEAEFTLLEEKGKVIYNSELFSLHSFSTSSFRNTLNKALLTTFNAILTPYLQNIINMLMKNESQAVITNSKELGSFSEAFNALAQLYLSDEIEEQPPYEQLLTILYSHGQSDDDIFLVYLDFLVYWHKIILVEDKLGEVILSVLAKIQQNPNSSMTVECLLCLNQIVGFVSRMDSTYNLKLSCEPAEVRSKLNNQVNFADLAGLVVSRMLCNEEVFQHTDLLRAMLSLVQHLFDLTQGQVGDILVILEKSNIFTLAKQVTNDSFTSLFCGLWSNLMLAYRSSKFLFLSIIDYFNAIIEKGLSDALFSCLLYVLRIYEGEEVNFNIVDLVNVTDEYYIESVMNIYFELYLKGKIEFHAVEPYFTAKFKEYTDIRVARDSEDEPLKQKLTQICAKKMIAVNFYLAQLLKTNQISDNILEILVRELLLSETNSRALFSIMYRSNILMVLTKVSVCSESQLAGVLNKLDQAELGSFISTSLHNAEGCAVRDVRKAVTYFLFWISRNYLSKEDFLSSLEAILYTCLTIVMSDQKVAAGGTQSISLADRINKRPNTLRSSLRMKSLISTDPLVSQNLHQYFKPSFLVNN